MVAITRATHPSALWPGIEAFYGLEYDKWQKIWSQIFEVRQSRKAFEKVTGLTGFGLASVKGEGQSTIYDTDGEGPTNTFTHVTYSLGYIVTKEEIDDSQYTEVSENRAGGLNFSMNTTKEIVHANVFNRGFTVNTQGDGQPLFSAAHPTISGVQSNLLDAADISEASIEDAVKRVWAMKNDRGFPINPKIVRLIAHPSEAFNLQRVLKSERQSNVENNNINALRSMGSIPEIVVNPYLTDLDAWFIQTNVPNGAISYQRERPGALMKDVDFDTDNVKAKSRERYSCGVADHRAFFGNPGTGA